MPGKVKACGKVKAFAHFDVSLKNDRWSWSGKTVDGKAVVLQLWRDILNDQTTPKSYDVFGDPRLPEWIKKHGNTERIKDIKWAIERCDGNFRVVIGHAKDVTIGVRRTAAACPQPNLIMKIVKFNENTGEFRAEAVEDK